MSSGPVGEGQSYWCTIKISKQLTKDQLTAVKQQIQQILDANQGSIIAETRASTRAIPSFTLRAPDVAPGRGGGS
ncbi:MAG TPA: hypothetical protein VFT23_09035 [Burkholderiales bacterium]|jgi:hypothetical protein|nr:hypothetical protein [Burkholderiales bacterium]